MLAHSVFFWLRSELSDEERAAFQVGVDTLATIQSASSTYIGTPSATKERPPVDSSYDIGLLVMLDDVAAHPALSWAMRLQWMLGIARGVAKLHR